MFSNALRRVQTACCKQQILQRKCFAKLSQIFQCCKSLTTFSHLKFSFCFSLSYRPLPDERHFSKASAKLEGFILISKYCSIFLQSFLSNIPHNAMYQIFAYGEKFTMFQPKEETGAILYTYPLGNMSKFM